VPRATSSPSASGAESGLALAAGAGYDGALDDEREAWRRLPPWTWPARHVLGFGAVAIGLCALWMALDGDDYLRPLDDANLAFHEAGHLIYGVFGDTAALYGGTLGQLTFPGIAAGVFFVRRDPVGFAVSVSWFGQNLANIARYVADARAQELPLVGGGDHDWTNILTRWSALDADQRVAGVFRSLGWILVLASLAWLIIAWRRARRDTPPA